ncbi:hypothetical protein EXIGLDRAFT_759184 [Exidia glandulosa HHB12029]|uniref:Uncharacterized protein n=1 Tax=Exidia glandulosa HHB12029 TaxID=1314781 RepID=A0A165QAB6_EXIGL|nr:hypothetical protein EXIGLDRAFT_759184 [Exidia glandulosa HHB12029]
MAHMLGAADSGIPQAILSTASVITEIAEKVQVNSDAARRLSRRVNELGIIATTEMEQSSDEGSSESWKAGFDDFQKAIDAAKDRLVSLSRRSYLSQLLNQKRDADALDAASEHVQQAFDRLKISTLVDLHSLSMTVTQPLERGSALRALEDTFGEFGALASATSLPPAPQLFFGRDHETESLVGAITAQAGGNVAILGGPGMGKTSLAVTALHDARVIARFADRRYFVACDAVDGESGMITAICSSLGIATGDGKAARAKLVKALEIRPSLLVLDNFETVWEAAQQRTSAEDNLQLLSSVNGLSLILTARGAERPAGIPWTQPMLPPLSPVSEDSAKQIFASIASIDESQPVFDQLIRELDNIPLAVTLLASQAQFEPIDSLFARWTQFRTAILQRGDGGSRLTSLDVSIGLSLQSPRMLASPEAKTVLSLLSLLPLGAARSDFAVWASHIPGADRALATVLQNSLAFRTPDDRVRVLCPIREYMLAHHPVDTAALRPLFAHYFGLADSDPERNLLNSSPDIITAVSREVENLDSIIRYALAAEVDLAATLEAAAWSIELFCYKGLGSCDLLPLALSVARSSHFQDLTARLLMVSAELSVSGSLSLGSSPIELLEEARSLSLAAGNYERGAEAMLFMSQFLPPDEAVKTCEEARSVLKQHHFAELEAQVHHFLATAYWRLGQIAAARSSFREAIITARSLQPPRLGLLGDITFQSTTVDLNDCRVLDGIATLRDAISILEEAGDVLLLPWAHFHLGAALLWQGFSTEALDQFSTALKLSKSGPDDATLEMTCTRSLIEAHVLRLDDEGANSALQGGRLRRQSRPEVWPHGDCAMLRAQAELLRLQRDFTGCRMALFSALNCIKHDDSIPSRNNRVHTICSIGEVEEESGNLADARNWFILSVILYANGQRRTDSLRALTLLAQVVDDATAENLLQSVMLPLLRCGLPRYLALALRLSAGIAERRGERDLAIHRARSSLRMYDSIDASYERKKSVASLRALGIDLGS